MSAPARLIHVEVDDFGSLRFFAPPNDARQFLWVSFDDLMAAAKIDRTTGEDIKAYLDMGTWAEDVRIITMPDGTITAIQHYVALELIHIWSAAGCGPRDLWGFYVLGAVTALGELVPTLSDTRFTDYCADARAASGGIS